MSRAVTWLLAAAAWAGALAGQALATPATWGQFSLALLAWRSRGWLLVALLLVLFLLAAMAHVLRSASGSGAGIGLVRDRSSRRGGHAPGLLLAATATVLLVSAIGAAMRTTTILDGPLARAVAVAAQAGAPGVAVDLDVRLVTDPRPRKHGGWWAIAAALASPPPTTGDSFLSSVALRPSAGERVVLSVSERPLMPIGTTLAVAGLASPVKGGARDWFRTRGAIVQLQAIRMEQRRPPDTLLQSTTWMRERLATAAHARLPAAQASLLTGLVTGETTGQSEEVEDDVKRAGLSHLVAVSGSNVAVVVAGTLGLALALGAGRRAGWWLSIGVVWWFVLLVRAEPSVVRAAAMATLLLGGSLVGRPRDTVNLLAMAVLLSLLADPLLATQIGFALSVAATLGVLLLSPHVMTVLPGPGPLVAVVAATVGAQVAVAPILLLVGGGVSAAALPANVVAVPAAAVASVLGAMAALLATVTPGLAGHVALLAQPALAVVLWAAETFAGSTGVVVDRWAPRALLVVVVRWGARSVVAWGRSASPGDRWFATRRAVGSRGVVPAVLVMLGGALVAAGSPGPALPPDARLVVLDVGQGDAILLGIPTAGWMLVDGGPDPAVLRSALDRQGVDNLRMAVLTHPHADHEAGLAGIIGDVVIEQVVVGPLGQASQVQGRDSVAQAHPEVSTVAARPSLIDEATAAGVPVTVVAAGASWRLGQALVRVLSPPPRGIGGDANESSLVLRIDLPTGRSVLLPGDAEVIAQTRLLADPGTVDVDVLKVPHHGGATNAEGFLAATTPEIAVISAGEDNPFGHPHSDVLADLRDVEVRRTDEVGDVIVLLD